MTTTCALLFHDVVTDGRYELSGFPQPDANIYKLDVAEFSRHLDAIERNTDHPLRYLEPAAGRRQMNLITFDDGGASSLLIADLLEARGWRGYFFMVTDRIGDASFLSKAGLRELHERGHVIGSHSVSHPSRMAALGAGELVQQWRDSTRVLSDILGTSVDVASVPGGYYSHEVGVAAAQAGVRTLFNSEPTTRIHHVKDCTIVGRFGVQQGVPPEWTAAVVRGDVAPRMKRYLHWNAKKLVKQFAGEHWFTLRRIVFNAKAEREQE